MHRKPYQLVAMGGTFDHFHIGHQHFIDFAAKLTDKLIIGVTDPALSKHKKFAESIEPLFIRKRHVLKYCRENRIRVELVDLDDAFGPTIDEKVAVQALVVTEYTQHGAQAINNLRLKLRQRVLPVHVCSLLRDSQGEVISSTRIRSGEINTSGQILLPQITDPIKLSPTQRQFFQHKQGEVVDLSLFLPPENTTLVGDQTLQTFIDHHWPFNLAIFDNLNQRQTIKQIVAVKKVQLTITNPAGLITPELVAGVKQAITNNLNYVKVEGEEDLATVVAVLALPLNSHLFYGQSGEGIIHLEITEELKKKFHQVIFEQK